MIVFGSMHIQPSYSLFFYFFTHNTTQHSKYNKTNNRHILNISKSSQKGGREGRTIKTQKSLLYIIHCISNKNTAKHQWSEGLAPPTRAVVHSHVTICRRLRIQYASLHMCGVNQFWIIVFFTAVKPANNILFCIELIQRPESSLRRHKLGLTDQSIRSNDDKTRFTCVHRLMKDRTFPKHMQKSARWCSVTYMAVQIWL